MMNKGGVYCIKNNLNGKLYVGSSVNIKARFNVHRHALRSGTHANIALQSAWVKYGEGAFSFDVLEIIADRKNLTEFEQFFINWLDTVAPGGYNIRPFASSNYGLHHTQETRDKMAKAITGRKNPGSSAAHKGKKLSKEHIEKVAAANRGQKRSAETKAKLSERAKGNKRWLGKTHSIETREKMSVAARLRKPRTGWHHTDESKALISQKKREQYFNKLQKAA